MFQPADDPIRDAARDARDPIDRVQSAFTARWRRLGATPLGANATAALEALLYLALIALVAWLWSAPEADFRYWGF